MKKNKLRAYFWIAIGSIILGIIISFQIKVVRNKILNGFSPSVKSAQVMEKYNEIVQRKDALEKEIIVLETELENIKKSASKESAVVKSLNKQLKKYKKIAGFSDVYGPGVEIYIDNDNDFSMSDESKNIIYEYDLLLFLVNELNSAGAEAISINDERIINNTEIRTAGNNLMVNNIPLSAPIVVKAIGSSETMAGAINQRFGIVSRIRESGYIIEVKAKDRVEISEFDGQIDFNYLEIKSQ